MHWSVQDNEIILFQKLKYDANLYIGLYMKDEQRAFVAQADGPYQWTLTFYRPYYNKLVAYATKDYISEDEAAGLVDRVFEKIKQYPKKGLDNIDVGEEWGNVKDSRDLPDDTFYSHKTVLLDLHPNEEHSWS